MYVCLARSSKSQRNDARQGHRIHLSVSRGDLTDEKKTKKKGQRGGKRRKKSNGKSKMYLQEDAIRDLLGIFL